MGALLPEPDHPLFNEFKLKQVQSLGETYNSQKELLDKIHEKKGENVFVSTYFGFQDNRTGRVASYSVWAEGITSWLPRTNIIGFARGTRGSVRYHEWDRVAEVAGGLLQPLAIYPPRYRVSEFPTDSQFAALGDPISL